MRAIVLVAVVAIGCTKPKRSDDLAAPTEPVATVDPNMGKHAAWLKASIANPETPEAGLTSKDKSSDHYEFSLKHDGCAVRLTYDTAKWASYRVAAEYEERCRPEVMVGLLVQEGEPITYPMPKIFHVKWYRVTAGPMAGHVVGVDYDRFKKPTAWRMMSEAWVCREKHGNEHLTARVQHVMSKKPCNDYKGNDASK